MINDCMPFKGANYFNLFTSPSLSISYSEPTGLSEYRVEIRES